MGDRGWLQRIVKFNFISLVILSCCFKCKASFPFRLQGQSGGWEFPWDGTWVPLGGYCTIIVWSSQMMWVGAGLECRSDTASSNKLCSTQRGVLDPSASFLRDLCCMMLPPQAPATSSKHNARTLSWEKASTLLWFWICLPTLQTNTTMAGFASSCYLLILFLFIKTTQGLN